MARSRGREIPIGTGPMSVSLPEPRDGVDVATFELWHELFGRSPTSAEHADWSGKLLRGVPIRDVRAALEASPECAAFRAESEEIRAIEATGLFDADWYRHRYPDVEQAMVRPIRHYVAHGWREDRAPNPWFDPVWYRATYGPPMHENPLLHYAARGEAQYFRPCENFDPAWYRDTYDLGAEQPPLADFLRRRRTHTVAPSAAMWPALGVAEPCLTPIADDVFLTIGNANAAEVILRDAGVFDENYYALQSGDVIASATDLLAHYCAFGWNELRHPNFYFDRDWYAATNPEVTRLGVNPLVHYLLVGEPEGRRPIVFFDPVWYAKTYGLSHGVSPLAHFLAHRREGVVSPNELFNPSWYAAQKNEAPRVGRDPFTRFLVAGLTEDFSPSPNFDLSAWRRRTTGRPSRAFRHLVDPMWGNPLVRYLLSTYR